MLQMKGIGFWVLGGALMASLVLNLTLLSRLEKLKLAPPSGPSDQPFIDQAAKFWAMKTHSSPSIAMKDRYAKVVYMGDEVCVSIDNEIGGAGEAPVYCFDVKSRELTRKYDDVE